MRWSPLTHLENDLLTGACCCAAGRVLLAPEAVPIAELCWLLPGTPTDEDRIALRVWAAPPPPPSFAKLMLNMAPYSRTVPVRRHTAYDAVSCRFRGRREGMRETLFH